MLTLTELKEKIAEQYDEITILELLEINSFDLVEAFSDKLEEKYDKIIQEFDDDGEEGEY